MLAANEASEEELAAAKSKARPSAKSRAGKATAKAKSAPAPKSSSGGSGGGKKSEPAQSSGVVPKRSPRAPAEPPAPAQPQKRLRGKTVDTPSMSMSPADNERLKKLMEARWYCCRGTASRKHVCEFKMIFLLNHILDV